MGRAVACSIENLPLICRWQFCRPPTHPLILLPPVPQPGFYPRINATMLTSPTYANMIVSVIGRVASNDGTTMSLSTGDNGTVPVVHDGQVDPSAVTEFVEVVGCVGEGSVQQFVTRPLGDEFDLETYDAMITMQVSEPRSGQEGQRSDCASGAAANTTLTFTFACCRMKGTRACSSSPNSPGPSELICRVVVKKPEESIL